MFPRPGGVAVAWLVVLAIEVQTAPAPEKKRDAESIAQAEKKVNEELERLKGVGAMVQYIKADEVAALFPRTTFFAVVFRQYPVARRTPEGLKAANLFAVDNRGKVKVLSQQQALAKYVVANAGKAHGEVPMKQAARAYLQLCQHLHQDGFFRFAILDDSVQVSRTEEGATAVGTVVAMQGGSGTIKATLHFDADGKLTRIEEQAMLRPGPRPICQATKLLDADPVVRRMAEQDLLLMGTAVKPYLDEQRARATPQLQKAIDRIWQRIVAAER
jgi:hypothetical protein